MKIISIFPFSHQSQRSTLNYLLVQKLDSNISTGTTVQIYRNYFICFIIPVINNPKAIVRIKSPAFCFLCDITEIGFVSKTGCTYILKQIIFTSLLIRYPCFGCSQSFFSWNILPWLNIIKREYKYVLLSSNVQLCF